MPDMKSISPCCTAREYPLSGSNGEPVDMLIRFVMLGMYTTRGTPKRGKNISVRKGLESYRDNVNDLGWLFKYFASLKIPFLMLTSRQPVLVLCLWVVWLQ